MIFLSTFNLGLTFCGDQGLAFNQPSDWYETNIIEKSFEFPLKWLLTGENRSWNSWDIIKIVSSTSTHF